MTAWEAAHAAACEAGRAVARQTDNIGGPAWRDLPDDLKTWSTPDIHLLYAAMREAWWQQRYYDLQAEKHDRGATEYQRGLTEGREIGREAWRSR